MSILVASLSVVKVSSESSNVLEVPLTVAACELDGRSLFAPFLRAEKGWASLAVDFEGSSVMYIIVSGVRNSGNVSQYLPVVRLESLPGSFGSMLTSSS